jgi:hypothetical protein
MESTVLRGFRTKTDMAKKKSSNAQSSSTKSNYITSNLSATSQTTKNGSRRPLQNTSFVNHRWHSFKTRSQHMNQWFKPALASNTNSTNKASWRSMRHLNTPTHHWDSRTQWPSFTNIDVRNLVSPGVFPWHWKPNRCIQLQLGAQNLASSGARMVASGSGLTCNHIP